MKISVKIFSVALMLGLLTMSARAFIIFQDNFNYPDGALDNITWQAGAGSALSSGVSVSSDTVQITDLGAISQPRAYFTNGLAGSVITGGLWASNRLTYVGTNIYYFGTNTGVAALYFSYTLNVTSATNSYHAYFCDTNFTLVSRIYASTNTATSGNYRIGIGTSTTLTAAPNSTNPTNIIQQDLSTGTPYTIVARFEPGVGLQTVWVNPANEAASGSAAVANAFFSPPLPRVTGFGLRANNGTASPSGIMSINGLVVGTTFADVVPSSAGSNPPFFTQQPVSNNSLFVGNNFTNTVVVGGDPSTLQWFMVSNSVTTAVSGATSATLILNNVQTNQSGQYYVVATNSLNSAQFVTSSIVNIQIFPTPVPPTFSSPVAPFSQMNTVGDTVSFSVTAAGVPPPVLKWLVITTNNLNQAVTNAAVGSNVSGTNASTLTITGITNTQAGIYFVLATNLVGTNTSPLVTEVVNGIPSVNITALRHMVDATFLPTNPVALFTATGIVTTPTNMTGSTASSEFYMQDATAGISVFWSGAASSNNVPPRGAMVRVTAPLTNFDGLLEMQPVFTNSQMSVKVLSTNNPLPAPQLLPFDPNIVNTPGKIFMLGSMYCVASNVTLAALPTTFTSGANEFATNNAFAILNDPTFPLAFTNNPGDQFDLFYVAEANYLGTTKPTGPVTIYGVLGYFLNGGGNGASPNGWELTPTLTTDFISYIHQTNVLSHLIRKGDLVTNSFAQSFLEPGETITTHVSIGDPEGGNVTLVPSFVGLPADANWANLTSGANGTGDFTFSPSTADQGSNYVVNLQVNSTSGNNFLFSFTVYVPTIDEQKMYISEVFANPTTNTSSPAYNPLQRGAEGTEPNIPVNDQYIEIANLSPDAQTLNFGHLNWSLGNGSSTIHQFNNGNSPGVILSSNAYIVYGGLADGTDSRPTILGGYPGGSIEPVSPLEALGLSTNGGIVTLVNTNGFLVDRVVYPASALNTSFSRFPTLNDGLVPQQYISTNYTTAGLQYDGGSWASATKPITGVSNIVINVQGGTNVILGFKVTSQQAYTVWSGGNLLVPLNVTFGQGLLNVGVTNRFTNAVTGPLQFYYMTTQ
jgi:Immunoglobulin I-set domain